MDVKIINWHRFEDEMPDKDSVILVRGELKGNEHASEYYVFIEEDGLFVTAETGKCVDDLDNFKGYLFTHWAYIPSPKFKDHELI